MFAVKEGRISSVDATIAGFGWALRPADRTITFRHLANMTSGYALPENPGTHYGYNDYAISLYVKTCSRRCSSRNPTSSRAARIALARSSSRMAPSLRHHARWVWSRRLTARDFARIGWFWLNEGKWNNVQLLPAHYFDAFMKAQVPATLRRTAGGAIDDYLGVNSVAVAQIRTSLVEGATA